MATERLTDDQIRSALEGLDGWELKDGKLHSEFKFADFKRAFGFMTSVALEAEAKNHHPEWCNVYNRVEVWLTTHDAGGISEKDLALASVMDSLAS